MLCFPPISIPRNRILKLSHVLRGVDMNKTIKQAGAELCQAKHSLSKLLNSCQLRSFITTIMIMSNLDKV